MFYTQHDRIFEENAEGRRTRGEGSRATLRNMSQTGERPHDPEESSKMSTSGNKIGNGGI